MSALYVPEEIHSKLGHYRYQGITHTEYQVCFIHIAYTRNTFGDVTRRVTLNVDQAASGVQHSTAMFTPSLFDTFHILPRKAPPTSMEAPIGEDGSTWKLPWTYMKVKYLLQWK